MSPIKIKLKNQHKKNPSKNKQNLPSSCTCFWKDVTDVLAVVTFGPIYQLDRLNVDILKLAMQHKDIYIMHLLSYGTRNKCI